MATPKGNKMAKKIVEYTINSCEDCRWSGFHMSSNFKIHTCSVVYDNKTRTLKEVGYGDFRGFPDWCPLEDCED